MSTQLLLYKDAIPVSIQRHATILLDTIPVFGFAGKVNPVPLTTTEFPFAARKYDCVFAGEETPMSVTNLALRQARNHLMPMMTSGMGTT